MSVVVTVVAVAMVALIIQPRPLCNTGHVTGPGQTIGGASMYRRLQATVCSVHTLGFVLPIPVLKSNDEH